MFRLLAGGFALALVALSGGPGAAEDKKDKDKPAVWVKEAGDITLSFEIGKETAKYTVTHGENSAVITSKVKWDKDTVTSEVTDVKITGNFPAATKKGDKISFKWVIKGDTATLSDLSGDNVDGAKDAVEGEYKMKK
jgi:hypothetical protein